MAGIVEASTQALSSPLGDEAAVPGGRSPDGIGGSVRVRALQAAAAQGTVMDLREILEFLTRVKRTPISELTEDSDLCERVKVTANGPELSMPDKRACVEMAAKLQGFFTDRSKVGAAEKAEAPEVLTEERRSVLLEKKRAAILRRMKPEG